MVSFAGPAEVAAKYFKWADLLGVRRIRTGAMWNGQTYE
jgi:hypothetical protein